MTPISKNKVFTRGALSHQKALANGFVAVKYNHDCTRHQSILINSHLEYWPNVGIDTVVRVISAAFGNGVPDQSWMLGIRFGYGRMPRHGALG